MSDPKSLFGAPPAPTQTAQPQPAPVLNMQVSSPVSGQQLAPFTLQEVVTYGGAAEQKAGGIVQKINASTRAGDIDEMGKALNSLLAAGGQYDPTKLKPGGVLGFFKKKKRELEAHFASVDAQVNGLAGDVEKQIKHFAARIGDLEALGIDNQARHTDLGKVIAEAQTRIAAMKANPPAVIAGDTFSAQKLDNWNQVISYAEKRCDDLGRVRTLCELYGPQIEMMKQNAGLLVMKFSEVKSTTLPQMQQTFSLYIMNMESEKGAAFAKQITDTNNELIRQNAAKLGQATVAVRTEMSRSSIDLSTLQFAKDEFVRTMDAVKQIGDATAQRLAAEAPQVQQLSQEVMARLTQQPAHP